MSLIKDSSIRHPLVAHVNRNYSLDAHASIEASSNVISSSSEANDK